MKSILKLLILLRTSFVESVPNNKKFESFLGNTISRKYKKYTFPGLCALIFILKEDKIINDAELVTLYEYLNYHRPKSYKGVFWFNIHDSEKHYQERLDFLDKLIEKESIKI